MSCFLCFTSSVSFTGSYTEVKPNFQWEKWHVKFAIQWLFCCFFPYGSRNQSRFDFETALRHFGDDVGIKYIPYCRLLRKLAVVYTKPYVFSNWNFVYKKRILLVNIFDWECFSQQQLFYSSQCCNSRVRMRHLLYLNFPLWEAAALRIKASLWEVL